jgi:hypothetical protein
MPSYATKTVGDLLADARELLNDTIPISGTPRFSDESLVIVLNEAIQQMRVKRPDAFLTFGLRMSPPQYVMPTDENTVFPWEDQFYSPLMYYVVGRAELVEDTFADNGRAITLVNKFTSQLLRVAS